MESFRDEDWDRLINGLREGDQQACSEFWNNFGPMLEGVARKRLSERLQRRVGPDDVVQSACRTFFRRVSAGQFDLPDADALWRLMCAITLTKARRAARDHSRQKRSMQSEQYLDDTTSDDQRSGAEIPSNDDAPFEAAAFSDQMSVLLGSLSPKECQVLDLKLQNHTNEEIAAQMQCSERTVRRITDQIRSRWSTLFEETNQMAD